jgi:hypothetical protein
VAANKSLILAGIAGQGGTPSLAWFAPEGTAVPTTAAMTLNVAFKDAGWCTQDGIALDSSTDSTDIDGFGSFAAVRTLITKVEQTAKVTFLETNPVAISIYNSLPLSGGGAVVVDEDLGAINWTTGPARAQRYAAVFDAVDGGNHIRIVCPSVEVTDKEGFSIAQGQPIQYGVTLKTYPDGTGVSAYFYTVLDALIVAP